MEAGKGNRAQVPTRYRRQIEKAAAKAELLKVYRRKCFGTNTLAAKREFVREYNRSGGLYSQYYDLVGPASFQTFERWNLKLKRFRGRSFCLADGRGMHRGRNRKVIRRTVVQILGLLAKVPFRSRDKWYLFLEALKEGQSPEEISKSVGIHISTVRQWLRNLGA
jgi:hypothetical protein